MNCHEAMALLPTFSDGELDAVQSAALEKHILGCADCSAQHDALSALRERIRSQAPYYTAPATLQARIRSRCPGAGGRARCVPLANAGAGFQPARSPAAR